MRECFFFLGSVSKQTAPKSTNNSRSVRLEPGESRRQAPNNKSVEKEKRGVEVWMFAGTVRSYTLTPSGGGAAAAAAAAAAVNSPFHRVVL